MNFEKKFEQLLKLIGNTPLIKINYQAKKNTPTLRLNGTIFRAL